MAAAREAGYPQAMAEVVRTTRKQALQMAGVIAGGVIVIDVAFWFMSSLYYKDKDPVQAMNIGNVRFAFATFRRNKDLAGLDPNGLEVRRVVRVVRDRKLVVALDRPASRPPARALTPLGANDAGHERFRRERDGAVVIAIPAGPFLMGNPKTERTPLEHTVELPGFLIDRTPVQNSHWLSAEA